MTTLDLTFEAAKQQFFDRRAVKNSLDKGAAKAMAQIGGFVRTSSKGSIKKPGKRSENSKPGKPPKRHTPHLRNRIFFVYDAKKKSVVIGPLKWTAPRSDWKPVDQPSAAATLELGGKVRGIPKFQTGHLTATVAGPPVTVTVAPRPYMRPALDRAINRGQLAESFKYMLTK